MAEDAVEHHEWESSPWPLVLSVGILFFAPFAFSMYFVYDTLFMSVICLGIGVPLILISIIGWVKESIGGINIYTKEQGLGMPAMPLFILAEAFIFIGFLVSYWVLRLTADVWPPEGSPHIGYIIPIAMTIILVSSSVTMHFAEAKLEHDDRKGFIGLLVVSILLGALFLGLSASEWSHLLNNGFSTSTNIYGSAFYSITGFHASHVVVGLCMFLAALIMALRGSISKTFVKSISMYWHFVDIVWFFVVSQVYFW
jgi:cytochrome c oxidase subunit 3